MQNKVAPEQVPGMNQFDEVRTQMRAFETQHGDVLTRYRELTDEYNRLRSLVDKEVTARGVSCGEWDLYSSYEKVDANAVLEAVGPEYFITALGGTIETKQVAKLSIDDFRRAVALNRVPQPVIERALERVNRWHKPVAAVLP